MPTLSLSDQTIAYREQGHGPAVVFAHAMGFDLTLWDAVTALLPPGLRVVCYDLRGHGRSTSPKGRWSMGGFVQDAERLLDHLRIKDCVFVGLSLGGFVAQGLAVKRLDLVRAMVLSNTATRIGTRETWGRMIDEARAKGLAPRLEREMETLFSPAFGKSPQAARWRDMLAAGSLDIWLGCCEALSGTDFYATTASLTLPSLVIASDRDRVTPPDLVRETADLIKGANFSLLRDSGHLPPIETPAAFATEVTRFLGQVGHG